MIGRFLVKSAARFSRLGQQPFSHTLVALRQMQQQSRSLSILLPTSSVQSSFSSRRYLSKSTKTNKKYQVCRPNMCFAIIHVIFQPISYGPKSKRPIIEVYHKMTVKALAQAMDIDVGASSTCLWFCFICILFRYRSCLRLSYSYQKW